MHPRPCPAPAAAFLCSMVLSNRPAALTRCRPNLLAPWNPAAAAPALARWQRWGVGPQLCDSASRIPRLPAGSPAAESAQLLSGRPAPPREPGAATLLSSSALLTGPPASRDATAGSERQQPAAATVDSRSSPELWRPVNPSTSRADAAALFRASLHTAAAVACPRPSRSGGPTGCQLGPL